MKIYQFIFSSLTILFFLSSPIFSEISEEQKALISTLPADQQANIRNKMQEAEGINQELEDVFENYDTVTKRPKIEEKDKEGINNIFGYDLFSGSPTTFAQSTNIPVPSSYIIGAGDELIFQFFGSKNQKIFFRFKNWRSSRSFFGSAKCKWLYFGRSKKLHFCSG